MVYNKHSLNQTCSSVFGLRGMICGVRKPWASYQIREIVGSACPGNAGTFCPPPRVSYPNMHYDMCVTHVPRCMPQKLTSGFL